MAGNENAITIFELGICSLHQNPVEFCQKCNGNVLVGLCLQNYIIDGQKLGNMTRCWSNVCVGCEVCICEQGQPLSGAKSFILTMDSVL